MMFCLSSAGEAATDATPAKDLPQGTATPVVLPETPAKAVAMPLGRYAADASGRSASEAAARTVAQVPEMMTTLPAPLVP